MADCSVGVESHIGNNTICNQSLLQLSPYSPEATAAFATAITLMVVFTIVGNILVIMAVLKSRSLSGPQNLFLVSLAAADILVATLIIPFSLANELMGYWYFRSVWCEIYLALDVLFCTSSIVHLCAISLDRYMSVSQAVSYASRRTPRRIKAAILVVWLISAVISFPPLLSMNKNKGGTGGGGADALPQCQLNDERWYILYSTIGSFFAPCLIMILVYIRIYQIAKQRTRSLPGEPPKKGMGGGGITATATPRKFRGTQVQQNGGDDGSPAPSQRRTCPPHSSPHNTPRPDQIPPPTTPSSTLSNTTTRSFSGPASASASNTHKGKRRHTRSDSLGDSSSSGSETEAGLGCGRRGAPLTAAQKHRDTVATCRGVVLVEQRHRMQATPTSRRKALVNREKRFTFVLAVVIGVFVVCWFPFFFSYSLQAVCPQACALPDPLFKFFFWIGYCNSCLNPVIYTIFNKDFRRAFKKILCKSGVGTFF